MESTKQPRKLKARKVVTLRDVAERAGVSVATACSAISGRVSGNSRVSPDVAAKIRRAAKELRYRTNVHAQRLSSTRTRTVALVVKCSAWHNMIWPIMAVEETLRRNQSDEIFLLHRDEIAAENRHLEMCLENRVSGILIFPLIDINSDHHSKMINEILVRESIPVVQLGLALPNCKAPAVIIDEAQGTYRAVLELAKLGHRSIAHLTLPGCRNPSNANPYLHAYRRYNGYKRAMSELGLAEQLVMLSEEDSTSERAFDGGMRIAAELAKLSSSPTAIVAYSDVLAAAAIAGVQTAGKRVPQDMSIIGIDKSPLTEAVLPSPALVAFPHEEMGRVGTDMLFKMMEGQRINTRLLNPSIEPGQTMAPAPTKTASSR
jgi:LacI family repressor for deo operon, udp, cdd, tsx, nupC, and nupG